MSHFSEPGYSRVLIDENMFQSIDFERFPFDRMGSADQKENAAGNSPFHAFDSNMSVSHSYWSSSRAFHMTISYGPLEHTRPKLGDRDRVKEQDEKSDSKSDGNISLPPALQLLRRKDDPIIIFVPAHFSPFMRRS